MIYSKMHSIKIFLLLLVLLAHLVSCDDLLFVIEQYRHGARGPLSKFYDYYQ